MHTSTKDTYKNRGEKNRTNPPHFPFVANTNDSKRDRNPQRQTTLMQIPRWAPWLSVIWAEEPIRGGDGRGRSRSAPHVPLIGGGAGQWWDCLTPSSGTDADCMNIHLRCLFLFLMTFRRQRALPDGVVCQPRG